MMQNKTFLITFTVLALVLGGVFYLLYPTPDEYRSPDKIDDDGVVFCTMDAIQCPDGSYVGRTGPNCEFVCPPPPPGTLMEDGTILE